ncbi:MAG: T9SS type A sorting domain-containing protein, partial [Bacteroidota bacterium]
FELSIDSVLMINSDLRSRPVKPDTIKIVVVSDRTILSTQRIRPAEVQIFPNPTQGMLGIESDQPIEAIDLTDAYGRRHHLDIPVARQSFRLSLPELPPGYYWIRLWMNEGIVSRQLLILEH